MIRAHVAAVVAALEAADNIATYDGLVPKDAVAPYRVVYSDQGAASTTTLRGTSDLRAFRIQTTSVGGTPEQARGVAEKTQTALLDVVLTVSSRLCWPVRLDTSRPIDRDDDVQPPRFYAVDVWALSSVPA